MGNEIRLAKVTESMKSIACPGTVMLKVLKMLLNQDRFAEVA